MISNKILVVLVISSFISGILVVEFNPLHIDNALADIESLYSSTPPILPDNATESYQKCDWLGQNCQTITSQITPIDRQGHFDNWCYSITNQYAVGVVGKSGSIQYFRTMSHDCFNYILEQKLQPINDKLDNLTKEIKTLEEKQ